MGGGIIGAFIGAVAVGTLDSGFIPAGWLGLALSFSIEVTSYLKFGVQMIARLEADMSSVERILYYTDNIGEIGTSALRLNISIIPQDPVIFSNTVRYNLDP